jgi:hypothetical protein
MRCHGLGFPEGSIKVWNLEISIHEGSWAIASVALGPPIKVISTLRPPICPRGPGTSGDGRVEIVYEACVWGSSFAYVLGPTKL